MLITVSVSVSGVHVLQEVNGFQWDDETEEVNGFSQFGYDYEDLVALDPKTLTWNALRPEAVSAKQIWDANKDLRQSYRTAFTVIYPEQLKTYVKYGRSVLLRTGTITLLIPNIICSSFFDLVSFPLSPL